MTDAVPESDTEGHPAASSLALTIGFGLVGVSAFGLMAAGPRVLGQEGYSALALTWTIVTIIGVGVATPGEQVITRFVAASALSGTFAVVRRRLASLLPLALVAAPILSDDHQGPRDVAIWTVAILLSAAGWTGTALTRGVLAGRQRFGQYAATLLLEAVVRLGLVGMALLAPEWGLLLMAASVSIPLIMSAALGLFWVKGDAALNETPHPSDSRPEQVSMTAVALLIQACLSTAPLWLSQQSVDAAVAGAFVTVTAYMRSPSILAGGLMAPLLTAAAVAFAERRPRVVAEKTVKALAVGVVGASLLVLILLALSSIGMLILYGEDPGLPTAAFVWLGASTVGFVAANVLTNSLFGCQQARITAIVWAGPALVSTALYAVADGSPTWLAAASAIGQALAVILLGGALALVLVPRGTVRKRLQAVPTRRGRS